MSRRHLRLLFLALNFKVVLVLVFIFTLFNLQLSAIYFLIREKTHGKRLKDFHPKAKT
jgi:hypothetical protein